MSEKKPQRLLCQSYALVYAALLPGLQEIAREHGYALATHGSMATDLDLIACPWTAEATDAETLAEAMREYLHGYFPPSSRKFQGEWTIVPNPEDKPHGRRAWCIHCSPSETPVHSPCYIDLSVMPRMGIPPVNVIARGTAEHPLTIVKDNDGHTYIIPANEEGRFWCWVAYMESKDENATWEGHEYDSIGCSLSFLRITGEVELAG